MDGFDGDMRDMLGFASHVEVCGIAGICGTDHLFEITPAGLPFLGPPPQSKKGGKWERKTTSDPKKRMLIFDLTCCLSII